MNGEKPTYDLSMFEEQDRKAQTQYDLSMFDIKKKEPSELSSMVSEDVWQQRLGSLREPSQSESPSPSPDLSAEPKAEIAKTLGEYVTGFAGTFNKALAQTFNDLDYVQATAGQAINQILFGKEEAQKLRELRDQGIVLNPTQINNRPFQAASNLLEYTSSGTKSLPETVGGQIASGIASIMPDVATTLLLPEVKTAKWISKLGIKDMSKFGLVLGGKGAVEGAKNAETTTQQLTAPLASAVEGYMTGMLYDGFGVFSSSLAQRLASKIIPQKIISHTANALIFGGYGTGEELLRTGKTDSNTFFVNFGMGLGMGAGHEVSSLALGRGMGMFTTSSRETINKLSKSEITAEELRDAGIQKAESIDNGTSKNKEGDLAAAAMNINASILKATVDEIKTNPEQAIKVVKESDVPKEMKDEIIKKVNQLVVDSDPRAQQAKPITDNIQAIEDKIDFINQNTALSKTEREIQVTPLKQQIEELKTKVAEVYGVKTEEQIKQDEVKQEQKTEEPKQESEEKKEAAEAEIKEQTKEPIQDTTQGEITQESPKGEVKTATIIGLPSEDLGGKVIYKEKAKADDFILDLQESVTDKTTRVKLEQFQNEANEKLATKREEIITDIQKADKRARGGGDYVDFKGERYKVTPKGDSYVISSTTKRTPSGKSEVVTNEKLKKDIIKEYLKEGRKLSDVQQKIYDDRVEEYKGELKKEIEDKLRAYQNERLQMAYPKKEGEFKETEPISTAGEQKGITERKELPSERTESEKKLIDTWDQFKKELAIEEKASKRGYKLSQKEVADRAKALVDMISLPANKESFHGVMPKIYKQITKMAANASKSEVNYNKAVDYIDKTLTDVEFRKNEESKSEVINDIIKATSPKALLQKGARGGERPKVKKKFLDYSGNIKNITALQQIYELSSNGQSKKYPNPEKAIAENLNKIDKLMAEGVLTPKDIDKINDLKSENELLEFAKLNSFEMDKLAEKQSMVESIINNQKTKTQEARSMLKESYSDLIKQVVDGIKYGKKPPDINKDKQAEKIPPRKTKRSRFLSIDSANFWSINSMLLSNDPYQSKNMPIFKDRLNEWARNLVMPAENSLAQMSLDYQHEYVNALRDIFNTKIESAIYDKVFDLDGKLSVNVELKTDDTTVKMTLTPMQAIQKILQWRRPAGKEVMSKAMGFTQETIDAMKNQLTPEGNKIMDWMIETMQKYSEIYDNAYIKENGVSFRNEDFYWTLNRDRREKGKKEEIGETEIDQGLKQDRTIALTNNMIPLKYGSAMSDLNSFVHEAIRYSSWASPLRELQYVYKDHAFRDAVKKEFGTKMLNAIDDRLKNFAGHVIHSQYEWLDKMSNNVATGILGGKLLPVLNQIPAGIYYMSDMSPKAFIDASAKAFNPLSPRERALASLLYNDVFTAERRATSSVSLGLEINTLTNTIRQDGSNINWQKFVSKMPTRQIREAAGTPLRMGDLAPIVLIGKGYVEYKYKQFTGKNLTKEIIDQYAKGDKDLSLDRAIDDWRFVSVITQQSLRQSNRSVASLSGPVGRTVSLFTSGPLSAHRMVSNGVREWNKAIKTGDYDRGINAVKAVLVGHVLSGLIYGLVDNRFKVKTKDDVAKLAVSMAIGNLEGIAYTGRVIAMLKSELMNSPWAKDYRLQLTPVIRNLENLVRASDGLIKEYSAPVSKENRIKEYYAKLASSMSMFMGLPVDATLKLWKGIGDTKETGDVSWKTFGIFDEGDDRWSPVADLSIGKYKTYKEALDDAQYYFGIDSDGKIKFATMDEYKDLAERIAGSSFSPKEILTRVKNQVLNERFKYLYTKYGDLNSPSAIQKVIDRELKSPKANQDDIEKLRDMQEDMLTFEPYEEIADALDEVVDMKEEIQETIGISK